ncbi:MAG: M48 family metalloprotease, partial [Gallionellaceae bacterium]|nr:M48 family metalloprotease [Gallionellaceae bacterium]
MSRARFPRLFVAAACLGMAGCATVSTENRARMVDMPLASTHADIAFTMATGLRQSTPCNESAACPNASDSAPQQRFAQQVQRVTGVLQEGAQRLYPDLVQRVPGMVAGRFDVYVVDGDEPGSASSANGRIALNAGLGARQPYDDWMAFVIAREMAHVIARHHEENSSAGIATSVIMNILIPGSSLLKSLLSAGGSGIAAKSQRDVQSLEADAMAHELLEAAGYHLRNIYLTLLIEPVVLDDGQWSRSFRA